MATNAAPKPGDHYLSFDGHNDYVEIPDMRCYSVDHTGFFAVSAWLRADVADFPTPERTHDYVHWLGKGEGNHEGGTQEWVFRMYSFNTPNTCPARPQRTSFYVFNPQGGLGVGSYIQQPTTTGTWRHLVALVDNTRTYLYCDGQFADCDTYRGPASGGCRIMVHKGEQVVINPIHGSAPLRIGAQEVNKSYFLGGISKVRIWNRLLTPEEIEELYINDTAPRDRLAGEFLLNEGTGTIAMDSAYRNHGTIHGATWAIQT